jgi:hypothetical protein
MPVAINIEVAPSPTNTTAIQLHCGMEYAGAFSQKNRAASTVTMNVIKGSVAQTACLSRA